ncbi:MAG: hypothetical protein IM594_03845 [Cytophagales bacterium]|jgi:DNA mismatch repair ATPase MutS|nr:hypothetical protein [Cytophagales bacterium]MCA6386275.1 hypothetical protein [Cytophagales bacterium]MCA6391472.1 hypothetical protein [Cytophagales bacterium]MCA6399140.1 hypothetical protein [Cytophagales bacterium]MCA6401502.1 hypothetical protein [Cytophagales bacterium]
MASTEFYQQRVDHFQKKISEVDKTIRVYSIARVIVALIALTLIYLGFKEVLFFYSLPFSILLFFFLVQRQLKKENEREILKHLIDLNRWEAAAVRYDFPNFPDGQRYVDTTHVYSHDLDLFGKSSLFQFLNRCATRLGENRLANDLAHLTLNKEVILLRQLAIRELGSMIEFRQQCWAVGKQIQDVDFNLDSLWGWLKSANLFYRKRTFLILRWALPAITCLSLFANAFNPVFQSVFLFLFLVQLAIASYYSKPITRLQSQLASYRSVLENYAKLFHQMGDQSFTAVLLNQHERIAVEASTHVHTFSKLVNALETRMNLIARLFGNGLFLYDLHTVSRLEQWREKHAASLPKWTDSLAEWDAMLSFATFHYNHPNYAFAELNNQLALVANEVGHPLIPSSECVTNSFDLGDPAGLMLITGANMAGKSTFLRSVGVNFVLGLNGSPVCASYWSTPMAALRTGMRTADSLQEHQSYFYAELNRLHSIIEELRVGKPMLLLLDEILKGTNSTDKQLGSRELIKQLIQQKALVLIATHDIALGDMEQQFPEKVFNSCFEGKIENDQLTFDYKLNKGVAQKANATFLMRKMGIIPPSS